MSNANANEGIVVDADLVKEISTYYAVIGFGLGILSFILLSQFAGGIFVGEIIRGVISIVIFLFAFLIGPIIAAFTATVASPKDNMPAKSQVINFGIAASLGFVVFSIILLLMLSISLNLFAQGQTGGISLGQSLPIIILLTLPNAIVGGGMKYALLAMGDESNFRNSGGGKTGNLSLPSVVDFSDMPLINRRQILLLGGVGLFGAWYTTRPMSPARVARATYTQYRPGDCGYRELNHPLGERETDLDDPDCGPSEPANFRIDNVEVRPITELNSGSLAGEKATTALVEGTYTSDGEIEEFQQIVVLRTDNGLWKVWDFETV
jgi:hypothetical protein